MDAWGHVVDETLGTTTPVRIQSAYQSITGLLNTKTASSGTQTANLLNAGYGWDQVGNLTSRQDSVQGVTEAITADKLNRIQSSTLNGASNFAVTIDATGNITNKTDPSQATGAQTYTYNATHAHAVGTVGTGASQSSFGYDPNGNMTSRTINGTQYALTWTSFNQLSTINGPGNANLITFTYGADHLRKTQSATYSSEGGSGNEYTLYMDNLFEMEITGAQTHYKHFIYTPSGVKIIYDQATGSSGLQTTYIVPDQIGSGSLFLNSAGNAILHESYSAYGYRRSSNWSGALSPSASDYATIASTTRRGYTDALHEMLDNVGLVHMNGRVYDPVIGRFLSPDPVGARIGDPQATNPYAYVSNSPLVNIDPTGLILVTICLGEVGASETSSTGNDCFTSWHPDEPGDPPLQTRQGTPSAQQPGNERGGGGKDGNASKAQSQTPDPCAHNAVAKWLYDNVSGEAGADAGMGPGVSGSVDLSLKEVGVDGGLGLMQFGAEAHAGVNVQLAGPGVDNGFFGETQFCIELGLGLCGTAQHQGGHTSFSLTAGVGLGLSFTNALKYHKSILPPAPMPAPSGCPGMR